MKKRILIVVGSTGGHYFPGITLGEKLKEISPETEVFFAGEKKIKNLEIWKIRNLNFVSAAVLKRPARKIFILSFFFQIWFVLIRSILLIRRIRPQLVVCMGSYSSVFPGISARILGKPVIAHEQNLVPGLANRILNCIGIPVAITFSETKKFLKRTLHTGLPLRKEMLYTKSKPEDFGLLPDRKTILVLGGSQGAVFINNLVLSAIEKLKEKYQFVHITGRVDYERVQYFYKSKDVIGIVKDFTLELPAFMNFADIGIARAGAGTLVELSFKGIPSILIPYRYGSGHQLYNAKWAEKFGCITLEESDATAEKLLNSLSTLEHHLEEKKRIFQSADIADIDGRFARYCLKIMDENEKLA